MRSRKTRRFACLALALALILALSGCTPGSSSAPSPTPAPADWDQAGLHAALEQCVSFGPGEAGVSLKTVIAACGMLDWAEDNPTDPNDAAIIRCIEDWLGEKDLETRELFWENWPSIDAQAHEIIDDPAAAADLLSSAGDPQNHDRYTLARFTRLCDCVAACEDC